MKDAYRRFTFSLLGGTALALASLPLTLATALAQFNCGAVRPAAARLARKAPSSISFFSNSSPCPISSAGMSVMQGDMAAVTNIYLNATVAQRNQAATNYNLDGYNPAFNVFNQVSPSSQILSTLQAFPQLQASGALAAAISGTLAPFLSGGSPPTPYGGGVGAAINAALSVQQISALKDTFTAYARAFQGQSTQYANAGQIDPRPFQISQTIANAPWTPGQASSTSIANQQGDWGAPGSGGGFQTSGAFPSGHSAAGDTTSLIYAIMLPEAYQSLMVSAQQFGLSRNILGVHHTLDVIGSRIVTYSAVTQLLAGTYTATGINSFPTLVSALATQLRDELGPTLTTVPYASCASNVAGCVASGAFPTAAQFTTANQAYANQATYGLPSLGPTNAAPVVPTNAYLLIQSRFPYLNSSQLGDSSCQHRAAVRWRVQRRQRLGAPQPLRRRRLRRLHLQRQRDDERRLGRLQRHRHVEQQHQRPRRPHQARHRHARARRQQRLYRRHGRRRRHAGAHRRRGWAVSASCRAPLS